MPFLKAQIPRSYAQPQNYSIQEKELKSDIEERSLNIREIWKH